PKRSSTVCGAAEFAAESPTDHMKKGTRRSGSPCPSNASEAYFRWFDRCLFISNMLTRSLPPKIGLRVESAMISRLFCGFCRLFLRMWSHTFETTWLRGSGELPVIFARSDDGVTGRANPPPALRLPCAITALLLFLLSIERKAGRFAMLYQREIQRFSLANGTTRLPASWPMSARPPNRMPERAHHCSTIAASSHPKSG